MAFGFAGRSMQVKPAAFAFSQAVTAIAIAATLDTRGLYETVARGWVFVAVVFTIACGTAVGWALVHLRKLPGTTAAWGCLPGAASIMGALAAESGGNGIMVSVMHYLRIVLVVATCPVIAGVLAADSPAATTASHISASVAHAHSAYAGLVGILLAGFGCWIGTRYRISGGAFFVTLAMGAAWMAWFPIALQVPKPLLSAAFMILGAAIGLQFRREHAGPMLRSMPVMLAAVVSIVFLCGVSAWLLTLISPTNLLTAYLATSPGGLDTIAAIAIGADVDMNFVVAVQTVRFFLVILIGPSLARSMSKQFGNH
ncbi:AbrB family transcriptional regulator [Cupriavidus oxalaticus]|uniref:AbrB family transcriptional regulator n=1 Tax=Cupriavidus oxalaticus TaxID=96344 RepID=UPI0040339553